MPVQTGTHRNGARYAKVWLSERGISATVEGTGPTDENAIADLEYKLRQLAEMAEDEMSSLSRHEDSRPKNE